MFLELMYSAKAVAPAVVVVVVVGVVVVGLKSGENIWSVKCTVWILQMLDCGSSPASAAALG